MHRLFEPEMYQMREAGDQAYPLRSVREPATMQMCISGLNPKGDRSLRSIHRRCVGHDALGHRFFLAPRLEAKGPIAIGTATSSEAP